MQIEPPAEPAPTSPPAQIHPGAENPVWSGLDLLIIALVLLMALFFFSGLFFMVALRSSRPAGVSATELSRNPGPLIVVPSMTLAYAAMLGAMYVLVTRHRRRPFWQAVGWGWPSGWWLAYMFAGGLLAVGLAQLSRFLPIPKSLPMDRFFQNRQGAYLMMLFGVVVAPLAEEMLFRGFLYPVLDRWLETLFMTPRQIRRAAMSILVLAGWGYGGHRLSLPSTFLASIVLILTIGAFHMARSPEGRVYRLLLPGALLLAWGLASRSIPDPAFGYVTVALLFVAALLGGVGLTEPLGASAAGTWGRLLAVLVTSLGFAMIHSEQLGRAWGPLLVLFMVGLVLTLTRVVTRSLAPGFLIHVGYNLTLFIFLYLGTDHFRHLERMTQ
jgi:membrane protease YdiL (CAAX protease family)